MDLSFYSEIAGIGNFIISTILTLIILYLTIKDKQKTKSLMELEKQTESLKNSFIELIKPNWSVSHIASGSNNFFEFRIQNIGGSCKNLILKPIDKGFLIKNKNTINGESYGSHSEIGCLIQHSQTDLIKSFDEDKKYRISCMFEDIEGRQYEQILVVMRIKNSPRNRIYFSTPTIIKN